MYVKQILMILEVPCRPLAPSVLYFLRDVGIALIDIAMHTQFITESKVLGSDSTSSLSGASAVELLR